MDNNIDKISNYLEHFVINNLYDKTILKNITKKPSKTTIQFINVMWKQIMDAEKQYNIIKSKLITSVKQKEKINIQNYLYNHIPSNVRTYIESSQNMIWSITFTIRERKIHITIVGFHCKDEKTIHEYLKKIFILLHVLFSYTDGACSQNINIYVYLTPLQKIMPTGNILDREHVNTAFTTLCEKSKKATNIVIFRKEEWFKVLIHECFHNLGLDFSNIQEPRVCANFYKYFPIKKIELSEIYCEIWAIILNSIFYVYFTPLHIQTTNSENILDAFGSKLHPASDRLTKELRSSVILSDVKKHKVLDNTTINDIYERVNKILINEQFFAIYQAVKILNSQNIDFEDLYKKSSQEKRNNYKENSEILAYYVFKSILFIHYNNFIEWCNINNNTIRPSVEGSEATGHRRNDVEGSFAIGRILQFTQEDKNIARFCNLLINYGINNDNIIKIWKYMKKQNTEINNRSIEQLTLRMSIYSL